MRSRRALFAASTAACCAISAISAFSLFGVAGLSGCGSDTTTPGEIIVAVDTSGPIPDAGYQTYLSIQQGSVIRPLAIPVGGATTDVPLPATVGVLSADKSAPVTVSLLTVSNNHAVALRQTTVQIPSNSVKLLRMPIDVLCFGSASVDPDASLTTIGDGIFPQSTCADGGTCVAGQCVSPDIDAASLETFDPTSAFGGPDASNGKGTCFDLHACFGNSATAADRAYFPVVHGDDGSCTVEIPKAVNPADVNIGVPAAAELCAASDENGPNEPCVVPIDSVATAQVPREGWSVSSVTPVGASSASSYRIDLPPGLCAAREDGSGVVPEVLVSTNCFAKTAETPICGAWCYVTTVTPSPDAGTPIQGVDLDATVMNDAATSDDGSDDGSTGDMDAGDAGTPYPNPAYAAADTPIDFALPVDAGGGGVDGGSGGGFVGAFGPVAAHDGTVFLIGGGSAHLYRYVPGAGGGSFADFAPTMSGVTTLRVHGDTLYFGAPGAVLYSCDPAAAQCQLPSAIGVGDAGPGATSFDVTASVDGGHAYAYAVVSQRLQTCDLAQATCGLNASASPPVLGVAASQGAMPTDPNGIGAYFIEQTGTTYQGFFATPGGSAAVYFTPQSSTPFSRLAAGGSQIYWIEPNAAAGGAPSIFQCTNPPCMTTTTDVANGSPSSLAANGSALVYYVAESSLGASAGIYACEGASAGGSAGNCDAAHVHQLVTAPDGEPIANLTLDSKNIYWTDNGVLHGIPLPSRLSDGH